MARAHGARAQMALAFESVYGTAPATGFRTVPFASTTLGSEQPLIASELLGQGRDPLAPIKDAVTADGDVVVPIDVENLRLVAEGGLRRACHHPARRRRPTPSSRATGRCRAWPSRRRCPRCRAMRCTPAASAISCRWQMARSGLLTATARLVAQGESVAAATAAGTPTSLALQRFGHFNGAITRNGSPLGNVISAEVTYSNGLDRIETIRSDGRIEGADPGMAALTGRVEVRFADTALITQAIDGTPCELVFAWSLGANASFTFTAHAVYLPRPRIEIPGPQGIQATFDWQAAKAVSPARMCTAVLVNSVASY